MAIPIALRSFESRLLELIAAHSQPGSSLDDAEFNELALELHHFQRAHNEPYARYCHFTSRAAPAHWRDIPALPTDAFRHAALTVAPPDACPDGSTTASPTTFHTSGTTGEGFGRHYFPSVAVYSASILGAWSALKLPRLPQFILIRPPAEAPHSSLSHMMGVLQALAPQAWHLDASGALKTEPLLHALRALQSTRKPVLLLGTALVFLHLFEQMNGEGLSLPPGSQALETGGYKGTSRTLGKAELYHLFEEKLGLPAEAVINEYSMTELSSQWYTRGLGQPHIGPAWTRSLVINPATGQEVAEGETGVLRLFDLANIASVLALQTHDLAIRRGSSFELLGRDPAALPRGCSRSADEALQAFQTP